MKTVVIPFTRRLKHNLKEPRMRDVTIKFSEDIKYLGITLDSKLIWNSHMKKIKEKAIMALMAFRRVVGQRWGLKPVMMRWSYLIVVRPMVGDLHIIRMVAGIWRTTTGAMPQKIQRLTSLLTTGAMKSSPTIRH
jgi:hypothetical protein